MFYKTQIYDISNLLIIFRLKIINKVYSLLVLLSQVEQHNLFFIFTV